MLQNLKRASESRLQRISMACLALLAVAGIALASPQDKISGCFYYFDLKLLQQNNNPQNSYGLGQAVLVDIKGKQELYSWNKGAGNCIRFTPEEVGDYITFRIRIAKVESDKPYKVRTVPAYFHNEGIYQFEINGKKWGEPRDFFEYRQVPHGEWPVEPGDYQITYRYVGRNPKSKGSVLNLVRLEFNQH